MATKKVSQLPITTAYTDVATTDKVVMNTGTTVTTSRVILSHIWERLRRTATNIYARWTFDITPNLTNETASAIVVTDASKNLATEVKATAFNKSFGTGSTNVATGNRGLPTGGSDGQILEKNGTTDYSVNWTTPSVSSVYSEEIAIAFTKATSEISTGLSVGFAVPDTMDNKNITTIVFAWNDGGDGSVDASTELDLFIDGFNVNSFTGLTGTDGSNGFSEDSSGSFNLQTGDMVYYEITQARTGMTGLTITFTVT